MMPQLSSMINCLLAPLRMLGQMNYCLPVHPHHHLSRLRREQSLTWGAMTT